MAQIFMLLLLTFSLTNAFWIIQVASAVCSNPRSCTQQYDINAKCASAGHNSQFSLKGSSLTCKKLYVKLSWTLF